MAVWRAYADWLPNQRKMATLAIAAIGVLVGLALVALPPLIVLGGIGTIAIVAAIAASPQLGLFALPACVAFGPAFMISVKGLRAGPADLVVAMLAASMVARVLVKSTSDRRSPAHTLDDLLARIRRTLVMDRPTSVILACLFAYVVAIILSGITALDRTATLKELIKWLEVTIIVISGRYFLRSARDVRIVLWAAIAVGVAEALLGFGQWIYPVAGPGAPADGLRSFGTFAQPNPYAGYLNLSLPIAVTIAALATDARERWIAGGASLLMFGALALADSRGGLLGIAAAIAVIVVVGLRKEKLVGLALGFGAPILALVWFLGIIPAALEAKLLHAARLDNVSIHGELTAANFSTMERLAHWVAGLRMFRAHPIFGVGAGNYDAAYPQFTIDPVVWHEGLGHAHNYYINAAAETGAVGLLVYLTLAGAVLAVAWTAVSRARNRVSATAPGYQLYPYALGIFAALIGFAVHNTTDNLYVHAIELQFGLEVVCSLTIIGLASQPPAEAMSA